jgi:two-component system chemotaxis response regulator CheB
VNLNAELQRDIVVIGASVGGVAALTEFCELLPSNLPACLLVVQHIGAYPSRLPEILGRKTAMNVVHAKDGERPVNGAVYIAPPDVHMLLDKDELRLFHGPKENHTRPAIDPLFRSAALACGPRVIGIVLTGYLDDGTAGLEAVKACGGLAFVQDPADAYAPDMPASALASGGIDFCGSLAQLAAKLVETAGRSVKAPFPGPPQTLVTEHLSSLGGGNMTEKLQKIGQPSTFVCPECGGSLWSINGNKHLRFRCHTGHAYTLKNLVQAQETTAEAALWSAVRALQDQEKLLRQLQASSSDADGQANNRTLGQAADQLREKSITIERMLEKPFPRSAGGEPYSLKGNDTASSQSA